MRTARLYLIPLAGLLLAPDAVLAQTPATWLDRPLAGWNAADVALPAAPPAPPDGEPHAALRARCQWTGPRSAEVTGALAGAGWLPYLLFDRELAAGDVEVVGGLSGADGLCQPEAFNAFVFVGGRFAGTLSPEPMTSRRDASAGAIRLIDDRTIAAEFVRYGPDDPPCCPLTRVTVVFRIDRAQPQPVVVPLELRITRSGR